MLGLYRQRQAEARGQRQGEPVADGISVASVSL